MSGRRVYIDNGKGSYFLTPIFSIHTRWPSYIGPKPVGLTPQDHLQGYKEQLEIAKILKPFKVNAHSGEYVNPALAYFESIPVILTSNAVMDGQSTKQSSSSLVPLPSTRNSVMQVGSAMKPTGTESFSIPISLRQC